MYVNRLIELYREGIFEKFGINPKYIADYAKTIYIQSAHAVRLDISKMYS